MNDRRENQITMRLREMKKQKWQVALLVCLSLLVAAGVAGIFHLPATTKTYQVRELTCTAVPPTGAACADFFVHIHNDDCYDGDGHLVCPLPEIKPHRHTEDCYSSSRVLACSLPESDGHQHTADCYTSVRGDLICELSTEPVLDEEGNVLEGGHVHTDECYEWYDKLSCGMEEGQGAHHHDDSCYQTETTLTCDEPEILLHTHTDDCYLKDEDGDIYVDENGDMWLICGQVQVLEHVHGPECFTVHELDEEPDETDPESAASGQFFFMDEGSGDETDEEGKVPETTEETEPTGEETGEEAGEEAGEEDADDAAVQSVSYRQLGGENGGATVLAEVPETVLTDNSRLSLSDYNEDLAKAAILSVVNENTEEGEEREISAIYVIDIGLTEYAEPVTTDNGNPIRFTLRANALRSMSAPKVYELTDAGAKRVKGASFDLEGGIAAFTGSGFHPYAIVELTGEDPAEETAEETVGEIMPAQHFEADAEGVLVTVDAPEGAFPEGTTMAVSLVELDDDTLSNVTGAVESSGEQKVVTAQAVDISFYDADRNLIEPKLPIKVSMKSAIVSESENVALVHLSEAEEGEDAAPEAPAAEVVADVKVVENPEEDNEIQFESDAFSVYVLVGTETITTNFITADGATYRITLSYDADAGIPADAGLAVTEILPETEAYVEYVSRTENALGMEEGSAEYVRLFDISIVNKDDNSIKYQPAEGTTVDVRIELADTDNGELSVVHFADDADKGNMVENATVSAANEGTAVEFAADGFSVYAIVKGPSSAEAGWLKMTSLDDLTSQGYYIGHTSGYYLTNTTTSKTSGDSTLYGIKRTGQKAVPTVSDAELYYFEDALDGKYYIYCMDGENKKYVVNNGDASLSFAAADNDKTPFTVEVNNSGVFKIHNGNWYWNMQTGSSADGFYAKDKANEGNNNLYLWEQTDPSEDTYGLGGKAYGLMTWTGGKTAKALMAAENNATDDNNQPYSGCLEAKFLSVMTEESNAGNKLYVPNNTTETVTMWTFEWVRNDSNNRLNSYYYLKADNGKYLKIASGGLSLVDVPDDTCLIQVKLGTGKNEGQIFLKSVGTGSKTLTYSGVYAKGYNVGGTAGSEWLYLVEPKNEDLLGQYEKVYTATKVSVSDTEKVNTGAKLIVYARQWKNDHYEYYAINSKGELVPCSESGDTIEWYGGNVNDMLWQFTEYVYEDDPSTPNGYYELENLYARSNGDPSYLAPKYSDGTILSKDTVGILLQGRTDKQYYTPIVAWDTPEYMYSALTVDLNQPDPVLEPCVRADGLDFYFAIMEDLPVDDVLHTVPTVDNNQYGIKMKMADFTNGSTTQMLAGSMNEFLQSTTSEGATFVHTPGLLSTDLGADGYPETTRAGSGGSLGGLYASSNVYREVNHLFIESTYRATGYYEYNSAQNFAYLTDSGDFRVYQELGTNDTSSKPTLKHGQFFPYNDIEAGRFASSNPENLHEISGGTTARQPPQLPDSDPRKHEQLYLVKEKTPGEKTDYFFGMELEASFVQTPSGLDAWGHDIIFEFSGDDDFWLYVDGELVIDLGGIHSAVGGDVNFRTGVVHNNGTTTSLYELFYNNYKGRGHTDDEAVAYVNSKFEQNDVGQWVFKDNTPHTMRIFYMERGAGASNLHMKFNLASVKKGTVELHKELEGLNETGTTNALFPYQVYYRMENEDSSAPERMLRNAFDPSAVSETYPYEASSTDYVFYKDTDKPVTFKPELTVDGVTYYNVFMLKPDETAVLNFPVTRPDPDGDEITVGDYRIVECGIDSEVFTKVTVNDSENAGVHNNGSSNPNLKDYGIEMATTGNRPKVDYVNKVQTLKNLTFTKELYRKYDTDTDPVKVNPNGSEIGEGAPRIQHDADEETFDFRLYFKTPYDEDFSPANLHIYHVKDPEGYYCTWNSTSKVFERITSAKYPTYLDGDFPNGTKDYDVLTDDITDANGKVTHLGKFWASFETSPNGSISGIPAYYTIEVRGLIPGTAYKLVERPTETPDGYKFWQYTNDEDTVHTDTDPYDPWNGIDGTIRTDADAGAVVKNYKGYGLRLEKVWEDASSMQDRDPTYFAVYKVGTNGAPDTLVKGSVQKLAYTSDPKQQQLYWWYLDLPIAGTGLTDYAVFEVKLTGDGITVGNDGVVSGYDTIEPILDGGHLTLNGTLVEESEAKEIQYTVTYAEPVAVSDNVRGFKATNSPSKLPPVRFVKTDWDGNKLPGADFSLRYGENLSNSLFDPPTKTSDADGLIAQVYLQENVEYTLTELKAPQGYVGLDEPLKVTVSTSSGWELDVSPEIPGYPIYYEVTTENDILTLTVKNHPYDFEAVKVDSTDTTVKLEGAKFDLYKWVTVGETSDWDQEHPVYTDLTTAENGVIPHIDKDLPAGTYRLRETAAPSRYSMLTGNIDFTVSEMGVITLGSHPDGVALTSRTDESGKITYSIAIPNTPKPLKLVKKDDKNNNLTGAKFQLTTLNTSEIWEVMKDEDGNNVYDDVDMTSDYEFKFTDLPAGRYRLEEMLPPAGYIIQTKYVFFKINPNRTVELTKADGSNDNNNSQVSIKFDNKSGMYTITVKNTPGIELPQTGGEGTLLFSVFGTILVLTSTLFILAKRKREAYVPRH